MRLRPQGAAGYNQGKIIEREGKKGLVVKSVGSRAVEKCFQRRVKSMTNLTKQRGSNEIREIRGVRRGLVQGHFAAEISVVSRTGSWKV